MSDKDADKSGFNEAFGGTLEFRIPRDKQGRVHIDWAGYAGKMAIMMGKGLLAILAANLNGKAAAIILLSTAIDVSVGFFSDGRKRGVKTRQEDASGK